MRILQTKTCLVCSRTFIKPISESQDNWDNRRKYCSKQCGDKAPRTSETISKMSEKKLGKPSWNKGKTLSEAHKMALRKKHKPLSQYTKDKMSKTRLGRKLPIEWRRNMSLGQTGEKGSNWQGGKTARHEAIRHSMNYREWRKSVFERDNYTCQECKERGGKLNADHIKPFAIHTELRFELSNGRTLCEDCHKKTDTYGVNFTRLSNKLAKNTNAA